MLSRCGATIRCTTLELRTDVLKFSSSPYQRTTLQLPGLFLHGFHESGERAAKWQSYLIFNGADLQFSTVSVPAVKCFRWASLHSCFQAFCIFVNQCFMFHESGFVLHIPAYTKSVFSVSGVSLVSMMPLVSASFLSALCISQSKAFHFPLLQYFFALLRPVSVYFRDPVYISRCYHFDSFSVYSCAANTALRIKQLFFLFAFACMWRSPICVAVPCMLCRRTPTFLLCFRKQVAFGLFYVIHSLLPQFHVPHFLRHRV